MPGPGVPVVPSIGPPLSAWTILSDYVSGTNLIYAGYARSIQNAFKYIVTSVSKANPGVVTIAAGHGLASDNAVTISGATGSWAALNGIQIVTVTAATTFTIPVDTSGYAGTFDGVITTTAPRTTADCWAISKNVFDGSNQLLQSMWANGSSGDGFVWDARATLAYQ